MKDSDMRFDRRASEHLLAALGPDGPCASLIKRRDEDPARLDVQLRRDQWGTRSWASLYVGLTSILDINELAGQFRLRAHPTHQRAGAFDPTWSQWQPLNQLAAAWPKVESYIDRSGAAVSSQHIATEGRVHASLCRGASDDYFVVQREASIAFRDSATKSTICGAVSAPIHATMQNAGKTAAWWPGVRDHGVMPALGTELDVLAVDPHGRLLAIEAKPASALKGIVWGPAQVRFYAELFAQLFTVDSATAPTIDEMRMQRARLGLTPEGSPDVSLPPTVVPVLAIGPGATSGVARFRTEQVAEALQGMPSGAGVAPLEIWRIDDHGRIQERW